VYASAHALGWAVADEPFGPWDRTGPPYHYPPIQPELHRAHLLAGEVLTPEHSRMFDTLARDLMARKDAPGVIVKMPHLMIHPGDVARLRPNDRAAFLLRHPLSRLNSLHTRGWASTIYPPHDLDRFKTFAGLWLRAPRPRRLMFDELTATPRRFFRKLWRAWGIDFDASQIERAVRYRAGHYHESSAHQMPGRNPHRVLSEHRRAVPAEAVELYLRDPLVASLFVRMGWDLDPLAYAAPEPS
jgi:hypothetical protein